MGTGEKPPAASRRGCAKVVGIRGRGQLGISPTKKKYLEHRKLSMSRQEGTGCTEQAAAELSNTGSQALLALVQGRRMGINKIKKRSGIKPAQAPTKLSRKAGKRGADRASSSKTAQANRKAGGKKEELASRAGGEGSRTGRFGTGITASIAKIALDGWNGLKS